MHNSIEQTNMVQKKELKTTATWFMGLEKLGGGKRNSPNSLNDREIDKFQKVHTGSALLRSYLPLVKVSTVKVLNSLP